MKQEEIELLMQGVDSDIKAINLFKDIVVRSLERVIVGILIDNNIKVLNFKDYHISMPINYDNYVEDILIKSISINRETSLVVEDENYFRYFANEMDYNVLKDIALKLLKHFQIKI